MEEKTEPDIPEWTKELKEIIKKGDNKNLRYVPGQSQLTGFPHQ